MRFAGQEEIIARVRRAYESTFVRNAVILVFLNVLAKFLMFIGNIYAARCLGPTNLGVSAQILAIGQQASIAFSGGFDPIAVREIAGDKKHLRSLTKSVILFRMAVAAPILLCWSIFIVFRYSDPTLRAAWLLGGILMFLGSLNINFVFQGLEKLPIQAVASVATAALAAGSFFLFFHPRMPLGSDLVVAVGSTVVPLVGLWIYYQWHSRSKEIQVDDTVAFVPTIKKLLMESWHYWVLAAVVFMYSGIQIPIVTYYFGEKSAGVYRTAIIFSNGLYLIYSSINSLLLPRFVAWRQQGPLFMWNRQKKLVVVSSLIGVPITFVVMLMAPYIYRKVLGPEFNGGERVFQILAFQMLVIFVGQIFAWGLTANGQHAAFLKGSVLGAVICIAGNLILAPVLGLVGVAVVSLVSEVVIHAYCFFAAERHFRMNGLVPS